MDIFLCVSAVFLMAVSAAILFGVTAQKRAAERLQNELAALRSELLSGASSGTAEVFSALTQAQLGDRMSYYRVSREESKHVRGMFVSNITRQSWSWSVCNKHAKRPHFFSFGGTNIFSRSSRFFADRTAASTAR